MTILYFITYTYPERLRDMALRRLDNLSVRYSFRDQSETNRRKQPAANRKGANSIRMEKKRVDKWKSLPVSARHERSPSTRKGFSFPFWIVQNLVNEPN